MIRVYIGYSKFGRFEIATWARWNLFIGDATKPLFTIEFGFRILGLLFPIWTYLVACLIVCWPWGMLFACQNTHFFVLSNSSYWASLQCLNRIIMVISWSRYNHSLLHISLSHMEFGSISNSSLDLIIWWAWSSRNFWKWGIN